MDERVADRFRIVRLLGEGSMGEVYEAEDLELRRRVALKTVRDAGGPDQLTRFRREVALATQVTHPSVCRIFDVGRHPKRLPSGEYADILFLTMELLEGRTLEQQLTARGRMSLREALPIVEQMAAALDAAHQAGVVHRDFKPGNVLLQDAGPDRPPRAVVTDFGVARSLAGSEAFSATATGMVVGTPAYMAPEQAQGQPVTPRSDIYALGLVMYEMLTGRLPEDTASSMTMLLERISKPPRSPRQFVADLDPRWEAAILTCLALREEDRFERAGQVVETIKGLIAPKAFAPAPASPGPSAPVARFRPARAAWIAGSVLAAVAAAALVWRFGPGRAQVGETPAVAVVGFKNLVGRPEAAWLSTALAEMLTTELAAGGQMRTIPGETVGEMKADLALPDAESFGAETLARIRKNLGLEFVVLGSYFAAGSADGGRLRVDIKLQDAVRGETVEAVAENGTEATLPDLVSRVGRRLRERLGAAALTDLEERQVRAAAPPSPEVARLYAEGLERMRRDDFRSALVRLTAVVEQAPDYPLGHVAMEEAWRRLGYDEKAREEASKAFERSANLGPEERLIVEARYRSASGEMPRAVKLVRSLFRTHPRNLEYGLELARLQTASAAPAEALETVAALRRLPAPARDDARIALAEAAAAGKLGDFKRELAAAVEAAERARAQGSTAILGATLFRQGWAYSRLGEPRKALDAYQQAQGYAAGAGNPRVMMNTLGNMGALLRQLGRLSESLAIFDRAIAIGKEIGASESTYVVTTRNRGLVLQEMGRLSEAREAFERALTIRREEGGGALGYPLLGLGSVLAAQGDLAGAASRLDEAEKLVRKQKNRALLAGILYHRGKVLLAAGDLAGARLRLEEALSLRKEGDDPLATSRSLVSIAEIALEEGKPDEALRSAQDAARGFKAFGVPTWEAQAASLEALALLALKKPGEAATALAPAKARSSTESPSVRAKVATAEAQVLAARGRHGEATTLLMDALADVDRRGLFEERLEALLALGEIERAAGRLAPARERLRMVEKEASAKGYALIARKAAKALQ